ncbi:MAG: sialidase family protein [Lentisphaeria bacterium]
MIAVRKSKNLPAELPADRTTIGSANDYKPSAVQLADGSLLLTAFRCRQPGVRPLDEVVVFARSTDDGHTWTDFEEHPDVLPREPFVSVLDDGTLLLTVHIHPASLQAQSDHVQSWIYRSTDNGRTWQGQHVMPDVYPPATWIHSSRNALQLRDGSVIFGISGDQGRLDLIYRSKDRGLTWRCKTIDVAGKPAEYSDPLFAETVFWLHRSGRILALARVSDKQWPLDQQPRTGGDSDQTERLTVLASDDDGRSFHVAADLGTYGMMYPHLLRLADGRLLLTYTVRALDPPLGVRAVIGEETADSIAFDFDADIIVIDDQTPDGLSSGGGFGATLQLADGALLTPYSWRNEANETRVDAIRWKLP